MEAPEVRQAVRNVHAADCRAYDTCLRAERAHKEYVGIQRLKNGGYRLAALLTSRGETCAQMHLAVADWASNVVYRLSYLGLIDAGRDDVDEYYDMLRGTT